MFNLWFCLLGLTGNTLSNFTNSVLTVLDNFLCYIWILHLMSKSLVAGWDLSTYRQYQLPYLSLQFSTDVWLWAIDKLFSVFSTIHFVYWNLSINLCNSDISVVYSLPISRCVFPAIDFLHNKQSTRHKRLNKCMHFVLVP